MVQSKQIAMYKHIFRLVRQNSFTDLAVLSEHLNPVDAQIELASIRGCSLSTLHWLRASLVCGEVVGVN